MTSRFPKRNSSGSVLTELSQLRDELRIKLHLAGLEVRAQWESVEPKLLGLERSLEQQGEGALDAAGELAIEIVKAFRDFSVRSQEGGPSNAPVHDIMRVRVFTCSAADTLHRAAQIMWEKDCGCLPVVDATRHVQAVITDRDICMAALTQGVPFIARYLRPRAAQAPASAAQLVETLAAISEPRARPSTPPPAL
jgi:CBS-domain-containing membrane protein